MILNHHREKSQGQQYFKEINKRSVSNYLIEIYFAKAKAWKSSKKETKQINKLKKYRTWHDNFLKFLVIFWMSGKNNNLPTVQK